MTGKRSVLIVDDDLVICKVVEANLKARGFQILTAGDGESALELMSRTSPDLVIMDIMMPGIDGIEVCRRIREKSGVPVVMLSARVDSESRAEAKRSGATSYISKPFAIDDLLNEVHTLLQLD